VSLRDKYFKEAVPALKKQFGWQNDLQVPKITHIVVNVGIGKMKDQESQVKAAFSDLREIAGQQPVYTLAKQAIAGFKVKQGDKVGMMVTLRGGKMWDFLERLIVAALPRVKDFQGIAEKNFSSAGDCSVGIKEHTVFPEVNPDEISFVFGLQIAIVTTARKREEGIALLRALGFPVKT
jgi:large subunit ribosomal protein L5